MPLLRITRRASDRLRAGHLWVYRTDIEAKDGEPAPGDLITVTDNRKIPLGTALYSTTSQIAARLVSRTPELTREQYLQQVRERFEQALRRRSEIGNPELVGVFFHTARERAQKGTEGSFGVFGPETNGQRLVFSEADNLPGIVIDQYGELVVLQLLTQGTAQDDVRQEVVATLRRLLSANNDPLTIWERPDPRIRELEQLPAPAPGALFSTHDDPPTRTNFKLNDLNFEYDVEAGQKTGAFLDQRQNYAAAAARVFASGKTGKALDICTYHGGFALHLAQVCDRVTGVDQSHSALESAERNLKLNPQLTANVGWIEADAFALLRALDEAHRTGNTDDVPIDVTEPFDAIVLDPPAFAKSKRAAEGAMRGYKELNLRAMKLLAPGGTLITCSCSHHVSLEDFTATVAAAAADAGRRVQLLETRAAAPDHPEVLTLPETRYLKCLICRVD